jgi:hypothetical protein
VVKDGQVVEVKEVPVVEEEMAEVTEEVTEEVAMEDTSVTEEEVVEEEVTETAMAVDPATDAEAIKAVVMPIIEEQVNAIIGMIADLKNQVEEIGVAREEEEIELEKDVKMSAFDKFKAFRASNK